MYILDTDISIFLLRGQATHIVDRLKLLDSDLLGTTAITAAELRYGAIHSNNPAGNLELVEQFLAPLQLFSFNNSAAIHFAAIKEHLSRAGKLIGPMDFLIAAITRSVDATLVTNNTNEFARVPGLKVQNWLKP
jgi:tRNA(fMet)-specific endonuclease VapC